MHKSSRRKDAAARRSSDMRENPRSAQSAKNNQRGRGRAQGRAWLIWLCILLPPIGLAFMWAGQHYNMRNRIIMSAVSCALLFVYSFAMFGDTAGKPQPLSFSPGAGSVYAPESTTPEPTQLPGATNLPYEVVIAPQNTNAYDPSATIDPGAFIPGDFTPSGGASGFSASTGFVPNGTSGMVYTAENSLFYHASSQCGDKSYPNAIAIEQARSSGLAPCNNCGAPQ